MSLVLHFFTRWAGGSEERQSLRLSPAFHGQIPSLGCKVHAEAGNCFPTQKVCEGTGLHMLCNWKLIPGGVASSNTVIIRVL